ncbi:MAG: hypothetical protein KJZ69_09525 [Phycisphaerales bacterium]|nr:hypothetical protein [Phycisphaerales bacterium]
MTPQASADRRLDATPGAQPLPAQLAEHFNLRQVALSGKFPFTQIGLAIGSGSLALEVLFCQAATTPTDGDLHAAWKERQGGRATPVLIVAFHGQHASLCGPSGPEPPTQRHIDPGQAIRLCREALSLPDRHAALHFLADTLPTIETALPGLRNEGLFANHELARGARLETDLWRAADAKARPLLGQKGDGLLRQLGYRLDRIDQVTSLLRSVTGDRRLAVAVLLRQDETPEMQSPRFNGMSPISWALTKAGHEGVEYVIVSQGSTLRLYPVKVGVGVGRRGRTETYVQIHTGLLRDTDAAYLWLLFSADALSPGGSLEHLLTESKRFAGELAVRLRERIYTEAVPLLAEGLARARRLSKPTAQQLTETYEMAMTVLFRLLFIAYAEDKDLLPYKHSGLYQTRSLKRKAQELVELRNRGEDFDSSDSLWKEVALLFEAVEKGKAEWSIPEYDGGLFSTDPAVSASGAALARLTLPNQTFGHVLFAIICIQGEKGEGWGPVDFRSLGVREFGTIYEGLLESELSLAEVNLTTDREGFYRPCHAGEEPVVTEGRIYLHNRSGARKATGSYFTKEFAVEHLLDQALEPALADHLQRLDAIEDADEAAERFFDFRVADIAMGSAHFLVAAIDRIERAFSNSLSTRPLPGVRTELAKLRASALESLGALAEIIGSQIEDTQLLRRLIARRCIYGVDLNPVSVQLARLSIWIHTFVPGLPLSLLDHNLVQGNSLVGIGRLSEIEDYASREKKPKGKGGKARDFKGQVMIGDWTDPQRLLGDSLRPLERLAHIADTTATEVGRARAAMEEARAATRAAEALCDIVTACRMKGEDLPIRLDNWEKVKDALHDSAHHKAARQTMHDLPPFHFPIQFPEVFLRPRGGFDVILGNPPWEEATLEEHAFLARHVPGLRGLNQREQEAKKEQLRQRRADLIAQYEKELAEANVMRAALTTGPYPGMGTGDPDLYKAFCWRFWNLIVPDGGWLGVVLPRSAFNAKGSTDFRMAVFANADPLDLTVLLNTGGWVFDEAEPRYTIGLAAIRRSDEPTEIRLRGPFASEARFADGVGAEPSTFGADEVTSWTDSASLPLLPAEGSLEVFAQMRKSPRLDLDAPGQWRARPHTELHATNDKNHMDLKSQDRPRGFWPVFKGESFDLWQPDRGPGTYYAWADPKQVVPHLHSKRSNGATKSNSVWFEFSGARPGKWWTDPKTLPCYAPRIAFRDVTNRTNQRTVIAALVPPEVVIANQAPFLLWPRGDALDEAFLVGLLSSLPLDWYARRFVETHVNFYVLNPFPIPRPNRNDPLWRRCVAIAGRLAAVDDRFGAWARAVGVECGPVEEEERFELICELDAVAARLYGLEERHLHHIFETFHEGWAPGTTASHHTLGEYDQRLRETIMAFGRLSK